MKIKILFILLCLFNAHSATQTYAQTKKALLIGISDYGNIKEDPNMWTNISGANDLMLLKPLLTQQGFNVTTLENNNATHSAIIKELNRLAKKSKKGDLIYLHFSMHGQPFEDLNGDEDDGWDEALIPVDAKKKYIRDIYEGENHLLDDTLEEYFNKIRFKIGEKGQLYVVLDACHSGTSSRGDNDNIRGIRDGFTQSGKEYIPNRSRETNDYFDIKTLAGQSPITLMEACRSYQQNREIYDKNADTWYGSLSYYVAKSLLLNKIDHTDLWIKYVKNNMDNDKYLRRQNMVIEYSR